MVVLILFLFLKEIYIPCYILAGVWVMHILIFIFGIKTYVPDMNEMKIIAQKE